MNTCYDSLDAKNVDFQRKRLNLIWSFKRKRNADVSLNKCKARIFCYGGQQELVINYWETCAPVVNWTSFRTMLSLSKMHALESKSIDLTLACL